MNWEEIKNVLMNIISSLEALLQSDSSETENAVEQVNESLNKAKSLIEKIDKQEPDKEDDEDKKKDEEMMKSIDGIAEQLKKQLAENAKKTNDRIEVIEKAFEELLEGMGLVSNQVEKEQQPAQIQKQIDVQDFAQALAGLIGQTQKPVEKSVGLRGAVHKAFGGNK